jgi:selT/selW/selH-like putative selenoprotein
LPRASSLAATLKRHFDVEVELVEGEKGVFDVVADGKLIFSKHSEGRFPEEQEIVEKLKNR